MYSTGLRYTSFVLSMHSSRSMHSMHSSRRYYAINLNTCIFAHLFIYPLIAIPISGPAFQYQDQLQLLSTIYLSGQKEEEKGQDPRSIALCRLHCTMQQLGGSREREKERTCSLRSTTLCSSLPLRLISCSRNGSFMRYRPPHTMANVRCIEG